MTQAVSSLLTRFLFFSPFGDRFLGIASFEPDSGDSRVQIPHGVVRITYLCVGIDLPVLTLEHLF